MAKRLKNFGCSEDGNVAAMTALCMMVLFGVVGAAIDFSMGATSQSRSQDIADSLALSAAAYVKDNGHIPTASSGGIAPGTYSATELGLSYNGWVEGGSDAVTVDVVYDEAGGQAIVTVRGQTMSTFTKLMGFEQLPFSSRSVVGFENKEIQNVASIVLVLDNSGSMDWDDKPHSAGGAVPAGAVSRILALEDSANSFMTFLSSLVNDDSSSAQKVLRVGMLAYNHEELSNLKHPMNWKLLSAQNITKMDAEGGTNPTTSMTTAAGWMEIEPSKHIAVNSKEPLRYVIFMSDGANDNNNGVWQAKSGTGEWRRRRCRYSITDFSGWGCWNESKLSTSRPSDHVGFWSSFSRYDYSWAEGVLSRPDDEATLVQCQRMKDDGVTIFTIGFGLETGTYDRNVTIRDVFEGETSTTVDISSYTTTRAYAFLSKCASNADTFIKAENADALQTAFEFIGDNIVIDAIRIKA